LTDLKKYARLPSINKDNSLNKALIKKEIRKYGRPGWNQRSEDVSLRYASGESGVFSQGFQFAGLGNEKQTLPDI
jgi:hypothetical protein